MKETLKGSIDPKQARPHETTTPHAAIKPLGVLTRLAEELSPTDTIRESLVVAETALEERRKAIPAYEVIQTIRELNDTISLTPSDDPRFEALSVARGFAQERLAQIRRDQVITEAAKTRERSGPTVVGSLDINGRRFRFGTAHEVHPLIQPFFIIDPQTGSPIPQTDISLTIADTYKIYSIPPDLPKRGLRYPVFEHDTNVPKGVVKKTIWFLNGPHKKYAGTRILLQVDPALGSLIWKSKIDEVPEVVGTHLSSHLFPKWGWILDIKKGCDDLVLDHLGINNADIYPDTTPFVDYVGGSHVGEKSQTSGWAAITNFNPFNYPENRR